MRSAVKIISASIGLALLAACGGGGGGDTNSTPPTIHTQSDVLAVAGLGILSASLTGADIAPDLGVLGALVQGLSSVASGSLAVPASSCVDNAAGSGTFSVTLAKSGTYTGFNAGDQISFNFANCDFGGLGYVINGPVTLTLQSAAVNLASDTYSVSFQANTTGLSTTVGGVTVAYTGTSNVITGTTNGNTNSANFTVPAGTSLTANVTGSSGALSLVYNGGTTFFATDVASPNSASRALNGSVSTGGVALVISTPTALAGTTSSGAFVASSGVINTKATALDLATSTTLSGLIASVNGDTNGDDTLDLAFQSTWLTLVAQ